MSTTVFLFFNWNKSFLFAYLIGYLARKLKQNQNGFLKFKTNFNFNVLETSVASITVILM